MRFTGATTKYDEQGKPIPKGRKALTEYKIKNPNGLVFDSKAEYQVWLKLLEEQSKGLIFNLRRQIPFELIPKQDWYNNLKAKKEVIRPLVYIADFVFEREGKTVVMDCKGWKQKVDAKGKVKWTAYTDDVYKIKKKLFIYTHPDLIFEES